MQQFQEAWRFLLQHLNLSTRSGIALMLSAHMLETGYIRNASGRVLPTWTLERYL